MKTLTLSLKKKWFDMIKSGYKKEEYREIKPYYESRFYKTFISGFGTCEPEVGHRFKGFANLIFTLGYPKAGDTERRLTFKNPSIRIGTGKPEWGAEAGKQYFVITWEQLAGNNHDTEMSISIVKEGHK